MKQGFTLIELLIVVAIVSVLAVVALPKYQRSLERGRALTGLANIRTVAETLNAYNAIKEVYPTETDFNNMQFDLLKGNDFSIEYASGSSTSTSINARRNGASGWEYYFKAYLINGRTSYIQCCDGSGTSCARAASGTCNKLGFEGTNLLQH